MCYGSRWGAESQRLDYSLFASRKRHGERKPEPGIGEPLADEDPYGVGAHTQVRSMAEGHQAAIPEDEVQAAGMSAPLLSVEQLQVAFGTSQVLFGVDLCLQAGEVLGLLGRNGMGKTTLIRSILGLTPIRAGCVAFEGRPIDGWTADTIARLGVAVVPEGRQVFPNLSVDEHLSAFLRAPKGSKPEWTPQAVYRLFPRLAERRGNMGNQLSGGEQQMLAIGRALVTNPKLLIFDEATEGLAPLIREEIWRCILALRQSGQTLIVVDKYIRRLVSIADRHMILEKRRVVWQGSSSLLSADPKLWHRYLGV